MSADPLGVAEAPALDVQEPQSLQANRLRRPLAWYGFVPGAAIVFYGGAFVLLSRLLNL